MRFSSLALIAIVTAAESLTAQQTPAVGEQRAEAVARSFFDAMAAGRFVDAARHVELDRFADMQRRLLRNARRPRPMRVMTAEDWMRTDPEMPRAVAEYNVQRAARTASEYGFNEIAFFYANVPDTTALKELSPMELAARWLEARDERYMLRQSLRQRGPCGAPIAEDSVTAILQEIPVSSRVIVGTIERGDTAYVLFRHSRPGTPLPDEVALRILTMRRRSSWLISPGDHLGLDIGSGSMAIACDSQPDSSRSRRRPPDR